MAPGCSSTEGLPGGGGPAGGSPWRRRQGSGIALTRGGSGGRLASYAAPLAVFAATAAVTASLDGSRPALAHMFPDDRLSNSITSSGPRRLKVMHE